MDLIRENKITSIDCTKKERKIARWFVRVNKFN